MEKSELMGHLIRTGELSPKVKDTLLEIASRAGQDVLSVLVCAEMLPRAHFLFTCTRARKKETRHLFGR